MHIAFDARGAEAESPTGKGIWTRGVLQELQRRREVDLFTLHSPLSTCTPLWHLKAASKVRRERSDLYISPTSFIVPFLIGRNVPCIPVIHDIIAFDHEPHDRKAKIIERLLLPRVLRSAAHICTVSEATKEELLEKFTFVPEEKVTVVYAGPTAQKFEARSTKSETISNFGFGISDFPQRFILCVGTLCPRKNQLRLIEAYAKLRKDLKQSFKLLLVGGRGWDDEKIMQLATSTPGVEWLGYLPQREVTKLLQRATAFAYPSLKEGFGIPVLDAMAEGIPVLTSSGSSMKEIAGEAALLVNPESVEDIRNGLEQLLANENAREHLKHVGQQRASAFSWKRTVDLLLEACEKAVAVRSAH